MIRWIRWALAAALTLAAVTLGAAPRDGLDVRLAAAAPVLRGDVDVFVTLTVTNTTRHPVNLLTWQLPSDEVEGALFKISRDGEAVRYTGPLVKRMAPQAGDHVRLDPGATLSYQVELTAAYDLSRSGRYAIEYSSRGAHGANASALRSDTLYLWLEGRSGKRAVEPPVVAGAGGITYTGNCSATQQTDLTSAVAQASTYSHTAVSYLMTQSPSATPRYTTWFGANATSGWATATLNFKAIKGAFDSQPLVLDCKCKKRTVYAYVYPNQPYKIYLCGAFWNAPLAGTDSRGGTLIHEMSHFTVVADTDDWAYGKTAAMALAVSNPTRALANADSYEYFAENIPSLP